MSIRIGIITVSDRSSSGDRPDESGPALINAVIIQGWHVTRTTVLPDQLDQLSATLADWADSGEMDVILTAGGTGFSPRDVTPEATLAIIHRLTPGIAEAMRNASLRITPHAMLSRAMAGIRSHTLIVNLPGNPKAAVENFSVIIPVLPHAVQLLRDEPSAESGHRVI
jgi:molybdenum cofactor synthesis domain-containing protein